MQIVQKNIKFEIESVNFFLFHWSPIQKSKGCGCLSGTVPRFFADKFQL
jgi:hypothetical protein